MLEPSARQMTAATSATFDPVTLEIIWSRLIGITEEMWTTVWRTAFSSIVAVVQDHGCELLDREGGCLAHAPSSMPAFNLTMPNVCRHVLARYPIETMQPGDVYMTNDAWLCAGHLPDICVITPIFYQGNVVGFSGSIAHAIDIGGTMDRRKARENFEEGIRFPILKLYDAGVRNDTVFQLLAANVRNPTLVLGDLAAEIAANEVGARRITALLAEYGLDGLQALSGLIEGRTEQAMRAAIQAIPDGVYTSHTRFDGLDTPLDLKVAVTVSGDSMQVDYAGTADQVGRGGINSTLVYTTAQTIYALMCLLTPHLPNNQGCFRPITVTAPEGSILNCRYPASVNSRSRSGWHCAAALYTALSGALPESVMAGCGLLQTFRTYGRDDGHGQSFNVPCFSGAGQGARLGSDGMPGYIFPSTASGMSIEVLEAKSPAFVRMKALLPDSGGPGEFRGGLGQRIVITRLPGYPQRLPIFFSPDRLTCAAPGILGGHDGRNADVTLNGEVPGPGSRFDREGVIWLEEPDDTIVFDLAGGGGYGDPTSRSPEAIRQDLERGYISPEGARRDYGYRQ